MRHRVSAVSDGLGGISAGLCDDGGVARLITIHHLATAERTDGAAAQQAEERKAAQNNARDGDDGDQPDSSSRTTTTMTRQARDIGRWSDRQCRARTQTQTHELE